MKFLFRLIIFLIANTFGLLAAAAVIPGFIVNQNFLQLTTLAGLLTLLNLVVKPVLKFLFGPIIILTFGLGLVAINAGIIYLLDFLSPNLTIEGNVVLVVGEAALLIGFLNFIVNQALHD